MKEDLSFKEGELHKARNTVEGLQEERVALFANLEKVCLFYFHAGIFQAFGHMFDAFLDDRSKP